MYTHGLLLCVKVALEWLSTVNCTVSEQYSCQHEVLLCALWSVLQVGESGGHQGGGRAAPNTHVRDGEWLNGCEGQLGSVSITRYM